MSKDEAIEILKNACKGLSRNEDFFKTPTQIMEDTLEEYSKSQKPDCLHNVRYSLPLTNQQLWGMAKTIVDKQREASKLTKPVDWNSLEEDWFDWLEETLFSNEA
jgi:hypothetical protein